MIEENEKQARAESTEQQVDPIQLQYSVDRIRSEQNLPLAVLAGGVIALVGAAAWAAITVSTGYQIGWMAVGIGLGVGLTVRALGRGVDNIFGVVGSLWALFACLAGNLFALCGMLSAQENISFWQILAALDIGTISQLMVATFSPVDLLFYGIAIYEGYKLSFRNFSEQELQQLPGGV